MLSVCINANIPPIFCVTIQFALFAVKTRRNSGSTSVSGINRYTIISPNDIPLFADLPLFHFQFSLAVVSCKALIAKKTTQTMLMCASFTYKSFRYLTHMHTCMHIHGGIRTLAQSSPSRARITTNVYYKRVLPLNIVGP